jgi:hypothetical protein
MRKRVAVCLALTAVLASAATGVAFADPRQSHCVTAVFCAADPAPDVGDQATADRR